LPAGNVTEFGLMPEVEGAQAADHMVERGVRRVYVLASTDDFAQRASSAFKAELAARGGDLVGAATLPPGATSYADLIAGLSLPAAASTTTPAAADAGATPANGAPADTGIFITMRPDQARLLLPQLRIARIELPVFATSHIYEGNDNVAANRDLDGVEFCDSPWLFDAQPGLPNRAAIAARLPAARGGAARLFAFGMDAWNLVPYLDWLKAHPGSYVPGASGQLVADQFGRIRRVLIWAQIQNGLARPLGGSLEMDDVPSTAPPATNRTLPAEAPSAGTFEPAEN
jgi:outer membrane PBP1 activator LpoA protein